MLRWEESDGAVNTRAIMVVSDLVVLLITHGGGLQVAQLFLQIMVVSLLCISLVLTLMDVSRDQLELFVHLPHKYF